MRVITIASAALGGLGLLAEGNLLRVFVREWLDERRERRAWRKDLSRRYASDPRTIYRMNPPSRHGAMIAFACAAACPFALAMGQTCGAPAEEWRVGLNERSLFSLQPASAQPKAE